MHDKEWKCAYMQKVCSWCSCAHRVTKLEPPSLGIHSQWNCHSIRLSWYSVTCSQTPGHKTERKLGECFLWELNLYTRCLWTHNQQNQNKKWVILPTSKDWFVKDVRRGHLLLFSFFFFFKFKVDAQLWHTFL